MKTQPNTANLQCCHVKGVLLLALPKDTSKQRKLFLHQMCRILKSIQGPILLHTIHILRTLLDSLPNSLGAACNHLSLLEIKDDIWCEGPFEILAGLLRVGAIDSSDVRTASKAKRLEKVGRTLRLELTGVAEGGNCGQ